MHKPQYISKEETISLCHPERSEGSLAGQRSFAALRACPRAKRRDDTPEAATFDSQNVFFAMYCPQGGPCLGDRQESLGGSHTPLHFVRCAGLKCSILS